MIVVKYLTCDLSINKVFPLQLPTLSSSVDKQLTINAPRRSIVYFRSKCDTARESKISNFYATQHFAFY